MNPLPELTPKQAEAVETLVELHREALAGQSRRTGRLSCRGATPRAAQRA